MKPGIYSDISNAAYHAGEGISKSNLDMLDKAPALLQWSRTAPEDDGKKDALNLGTAMHTMLLEPEKFTDQFVIEPAINRRTNAGKQQAEEFLAAAKASGRMIITADEARKINLMRESVMAHPEARQLMEAEGQAEASAYWIDPETNVKCRCRPDKLITKAGFIVDVKTTADMSKVARSVFDYRYHVQDAFYSDGYAHASGEPTNGFLFLFISSTINCGKYPVRIFQLDDEAKMIGRYAYQANLRTYAECMESGVWPGVESLSLPSWATK